MFFCHAPIPLSVSCIRQTVTGCLQKRAWKYWSQEGGWVAIRGCADLQWVYCKCSKPMRLLLAYDWAEYDVIVHLCYPAWKSSGAGRQDLRDDDHGPRREMGEVGDRGGWSHRQHGRRGLFWRCHDHDGGSRALWGQDRERPVEGLDSSVCKDYALVVYEHRM